MGTLNQPESTSPLQYNNEEECFATLRAHTLHYLHSTPVEQQCVTLWTDVVSVSTQWTDYDYSLSDLEPHLTFLWWHFCTVGMSHDGTALDQQRLLHLLASVKHLGILDHADRSPHTDRQHGRLWVDLPFLKPTMVDMLRTAFAGQPNVVPNQGLRKWRNLNALAARVSVSRVHDLRFCAVLAMRDVLEEQTIITADMLEVVNMWLATYGYWLEGMAAYSLVTRKYYDYQREEAIVHLKERVSIAPGTLAKEAGIDCDDVGTSRWRFWRLKLQSLATASDANGATGLSVLAVSALSRMAEI